MSTTNKVIKKEQCPKCASTGGDSSRNNLLHFEDGGIHCFACGYHPSLSTSYKNKLGIAEQEIVIENERAFYSRIMGKY